MAERSATFMSTIPRNQCDIHNELATIGDMLKENAIAERGRYAVALVDGAVILKLRMKNLLSNRDTMRGERLPVLDGWLS